MKATGQSDLQTTMRFVPLGQSHLREQLEKIKGIRMHSLPIG